MVIYAVSENRKGKKIFANYFYETNVTLTQKRDKKR